MSSSSFLLEAWIDNFKKNSVNNTLLFLVFKSKHRIIDIKRFQKVFLKDMGIDDKYYKLSNLEELDNLNELLICKGKKNIIVFGYIGMSIDKIANTDFEVFLFFNPLENYFKFETFESLLTIDNIVQPNQMLIVIKKQDPIDIISSNTNDFSAIINFLQILFIPYINNKHFILFQSLNILKSNRETYFIRDYIKILWMDAILLVQKRKLTAQLAIAIYKVATLRFHDSNTTIGTFFRKRLGAKSKSYRSVINGCPKMIKVYDLANDN